MYRSWGPGRVHRGRQAASCSHGARCAGGDRAPYHRRQAAATSAEDVMTMTIEQAGLMLADPLAYTDEERLHDGLALLRRESPVHLVRAPGYRPFYAVTRHAD